MVVLGPVIVNGDLEVELFGVLLDVAEIVVCRRANDGRNAGVLGVFEVVTDEVFVVFTEADIAAGDDRQSSFFEFLAGRGEILFRQVVRHVVRLDVDVFDAEVIDDFDCLRAAEFAQ